MGSVMEWLRLFVSVFVLCGSMVVSGVVCAADRPNVILILADDLAWSNVGCYGSTLYDTPHIDRLAREGMRFTNGYAPAPICSASRSAILTGRTPARLHFEFVTKTADSAKPEGTLLEQPEWTQDLPLSEVTIAEALGGAGYTTGFYGKWHVNEHYERYLGWSPTHGPKRQGFEHAAEDRGSHPYGYASKAMRESFGEYAAGEYPRDAVTENAIEFLKTHGAKDEPFFLYYSMYYVHDPVHTRMEWLHDKYRARLGAEAPDHRVDFGAMIQTMDHYVGQLMDAVREMGLAEDTLVVLMSDNGADPLYSDNAPLRGSKWTLYEGGVRGPFVAWGAGVKGGTVCDVPVTGTDLFPTFCELAGVEVDASRVLDGESLVRLFVNPADTTLKGRTLYWHFPYYHEKRVGTRPISSLRKGDMKLVYHYEDKRAELFDLGSDPAEEKDLAKTHAGEAKKLEAELMGMLEEAGARLPRVK